MNDYLKEATHELKRVDHIIYVSLKYTRTVDIIRNALHRLQGAFDLIVEGLLIYNQEQKKIEAVPKSPKARIDLLRALYKDDPQLMKHMEMHVFLRELIKAPYTRREEYRRHVTMIAQMENKNAEITIDVLEDDFDHRAKNFLEYAETLAGMKRE